MNSAPKFIGKRISVLRSKTDIVITISQKVERWQETLLLVWLMAWAFCGVAFITNIFLIQGSSEKIFLAVCSALWLYFFIRLLKVFIWRKAGREVICVSHGKISIINAYWKKGKEEVFNMQHIFKLGLIKAKPASLFAFLDNSFWIIGGDKVGFNYSGEKVRLGKQLTVKDAELLVRVLETGIKEFGRVSSQEKTVEPSHTTKAQSQR
ncbi:MAG: hypothetical protein IT223_04445 [Crocinitomicaceae bacterium]|nr:hypothetical protein [Crocinitomicaceae bacterium]